MWNGVALGMFEGDSGLPTLEHNVAAEDVGNTSVYGKSVIDGVYQGANWFSSFTCLEYRAGPITAFWPYSVTLGQMGTIGVLLYSLSGPLVLTAVTGTSATGTPATQTATKAILLPGFATRLVYGPTLRKVPLRFRLFPFTAAGNVKWFVET